MGQETIHEGGCLCGAVRYRVDAAPGVVGHCHCTMCRKASGAPVVTWAVFPRTALAFTRGSLSTYRSSARAVRGFCGACGCQITFQYDDRPDRIDVTVGSLDRPDAVTPMRHIWTESQIDWVRMDDGLPRHSGAGEEGLE